MSWDCCKCFKAESTDIKQLNYEHYTLHDVPTEVFVFERTLEELHLDSNRIRDLPRPLFHCHGLKILSLSDNEVHSLPPAIASLINLQHLDVSRNALNTIPDNLKGCKHLTYVDVSVNPLEKLPEGFTQLISLEELYLNDTYLDFLPANFGRLMRLKILELRENNLNTLPKSIARLIHLQRLDIGQNDFSDVPEVIGNLPNLTELWIDSNRIRSLPPLIGNLKKLIHLEAGNNNIQFVSAEIENCTKLVDLSLTCNELKVLPESIENLKELITLKVDDNQLTTLPSTIGNLSKLEELILSQNDLDSLPPYIGLLRKLHILNVDENMLEELPPEIGSCSGLTILSAHSNKLLHVPAEIGHLSNLHVINFSENQLQNLPVSILNLSHLSALWLSNNQSTPLTTLQQEIDKHTGQMVCTNFMLPQSSQEVNLIKNTWMHENVCTEQSSKRKQHISFATDADAEAPSRLLRAPTPYPKELRAMAKHARAIRNLKKTKDINYDSPVVEEMVSQEPTDVLIKEAKVKKPSIDSFAIQTTHCHISEKNMRIFEEPLESKRYLNSNSILQVYDETIYSTSLEEAPSIIAFDAGPVVREAKCVRKTNTTSSLNVYPTTESERRQSVANAEQIVQHPPPYHIAAAYSKQAAYFLQNNSREVPRDVIYSNGNSSSVLRGDAEIQRDHKAGQIEVDAVSNVSQEVMLQRPLEYTSHDKIFLAYDKKTTDVFSEYTCFPEEPLTEGNISDEVSISSLPSNKLNIDLCDLQGNETYKEIICSLENQNNLSNIQNDTNEKKIENNYGKATQKLEGRSENSVQSVKNNLPNQDVNERTDEEICDTPHLQKPQTFTQDKPVVSEGVIAPTPQRPQSISLGTTSSSSPDSRTSSLHAEHIVTVAKGEISAVPLFVPLSKMPHHEHIQNGNNVLNSSNSVLLNLDDVRPDEHFVLSSFPNIPTSYLASSKNENSGVQNNLHSYSCLEEDNSSISTDNSARSKEICYDSEQRHSIDNNLKMQCRPDFQESSIHPLNTVNHLLVDLDICRDSKNSVIQCKGPVLKHPSETPEFVPMLNPNDTLSAEQRNKNLFKWMFGLHKNATVFPVTIQKSSGLGISISGGMRTISNGERNENEIIVTKVHPNGPANRIIMPGDKILEVDGIDFTKLEHEEAVTVLKKTGNVVCMMISRQQL